MDKNNWKDDLDFDLNTLSTSTDVITASACGLRHTGCYHLLVNSIVYFYNTMSEQCLPAGCVTLDVIT